MMVIIAARNPSIVKLNVAATIETFVLSLNNGAIILKLFFNIKLYAR